MTWQQFSSAVAVFVIPSLAILVPTIIAVRLSAAERKAAARDRLATNRQAAIVSLAEKVWELKPTTPRKQPSPAGPGWAGVRMQVGLARAAFVEEFPIFVAWIDAEVRLGMTLEVLNRIAEYESNLLPEVVAEAPWILSRGQDHRQPDGRPISDPIAWLEWRNGFAEHLIDWYSDGYPLDRLDALLRDASDTVERISLDADT